VLSVALRPGAFHYDDDALVADFRAGHFDAVAVAIDAAPGPISGRLVLVRARIMVKSDAAGTLVYLNRRIDSLSPHERAEAMMLLAVAFARAHDDRSAEETFGRAATLVDALGDRDLSDQLRYHVAFFGWQKERLDEAGAAASTLYAAPSDEVAVRAKILTSLVFSKQRRHHDEAYAALAAFEHARRHDNVELTAIAARNLSTIARELPLPALRQAVRAGIETIPWTDELRDLQFKSLKAAAWCCALDGDYLNTFRLLKAATKAAPSDHWRVMAALDRSYLAGCLDEPRWAEQELLEAHELASQLDWRGVTSEEHVALALLAELYSAVDPVVSLAYLARFHEVGAVADRHLSFHGDLRPQAIADFSAGVVYARLGSVDVARERFRSAWQVFDTAGYDWRAGRCARELYALTGRRRWLERARTKLAGYSTTWLAAGLFESGSPFYRLTPAQRRVFDLLVGGASTDEIVATLGRSVFTVRNHIKAIFMAFGVTSRTALLAEASRLRLAG
jgi:DNA-binding CsgD family transcriptional regulator